MTSARHILQQGPVIKTLLRAVLPSRPKAEAALSTPTPWLQTTVPARPDGLIDDYLTYVFASPDAHPSSVPAHLFPQFAFPLMMDTLERVPYDLRRMLNGGCRLENLGPIPRDVPLIVRARLADIDANERRVVLQQEITVGVEEDHPRLKVTVYGIIPQKRKGQGKGGAKRQRPDVPESAWLTDRWRMSKRAGLTYACLSGDFNPIHWISPLARVAGFPGPILHGFATLGYAMEGLTRKEWGGDAQAWATVDVKFERPIALPANVGLYQGPEEGSFFVGDAQNTPAYLTGTYTLKESTEDV